MQCPNDLDRDTGNEVCSGLTRIHQTKRSIRPDITPSSQPSVNFSITSRSIQVPMIEWYHVYEWNNFEVSHEAVSSSLTSLISLNGRDRDRTDDLYRVKVGGVVYLINLSLFSLHDPGSFLTVLGV
jgi:hypothetical protein